MSDRPSPEEIEAARTPFGGWNREALAAWGVPWPPPKGWRHRLIAEYQDAHRDTPDPLAEATPTCPECLHALEPEGPAGRERWRCPSCGLVRL